jgi:deazaflavin-dependent oxidoreductase (nitroreductase family)
MRGRALYMEQGLANKLERLAGKSTLRLTHRGRHSGRPYQVTIWFLVEGETIYLPTANLRRQWPRNVKANPQVSLKIGNETLSGTAEFITNGTERDHARALVKRNIGTRSRSCGRCSCWRLLASFRIGAATSACVSKRRRARLNRAGCIRGDKLGRGRGAIQDANLRQALGSQGWCLRGKPAGR